MKSNNYLSELMKTIRISCGAVAGWCRHMWQKKRPLVISVLVSIAMHLVFIVIATTINLPAVYNVIERSKNIFNIKSVMKENQPQKQVKRGVTYVEAIKFKSPIYSKTTLAATEDIEDIRKEEYAKTEDNLQQALSLDMQESIEPDLLDDSFTARDSGRSRQTRKELVDLKRDQQAVVVSPKEITDIPGDFFDKMPGFTPKSAGGLIDTLKDRISSPFSGADNALVKRYGKTQSLDEYLICRLYKYKDPKDGQKYFKVSISAGKDAKKLQVIPKEIVFLVDCSLSIQKDRLEHFKRGLEYCLSHLNSSDLFNILAFKERIEWFRPSAVAPSKENIRAAGDFVKSLVSDESTDTYRALSESMRVHESMIPSYIVLLSDGRPTYGITGSREIINKISAVNQGKRPVFAFSGGSRVNRYLLDFISYKNRGWSEYAQSGYLVARHMASMYNKIKDPLFLNLRYNVSGLDPALIFPKSLPDFYMNAEFNIFGKYENDDTDFSFQLLGDAFGMTNEFVIIGSLKDARPTTEDIAKGWAFNRIYHLIGLLGESGDDPGRLEEIRLLCKKFNITTPYSEAIYSKKR